MKSSIRGKIKFLLLIIVTVYFNLQLVAIVFAAGSTPVTIDKFLKVDATKIVNELTTHEDDRFYLGTPYISYPFNTASLTNPNGKPSKDGIKGMNCTGFVAFVFQKYGADFSEIDNRGYTGGRINAISWFRTFTDNNKVKYYVYDSVKELLNDGKAEKGDLIYCDPLSWSNGADCHIGIFWGVSPSQNKFWHSSDTPGQGNQISAITPATKPSKYYLFKLTNKYRKIPTTIKKVSINKSKTTITVKWNTLKEASGYRIYMYSNGKWKAKGTVDKKNTNKIKIEGTLKKNKTYKFRIKCYKKVSGKRVWSYNSKIFKYKVPKRGIEGPK